MASLPANVEYVTSPLAQGDSANIKTPTGSFPTPLKYSGSLDNYEHFDVTAVIGREFPKLQLSEVVNDDTKIRDLAITGKV